MSWRLFARLGERFARLRHRRPRAKRGERASAFTTEELAEFLEGDLFPDDARHEFREQLREELWEVVQRANAGKSRS